MGLVEERRPEHDRRVRVYTLNPEPIDGVGGWLAGVTRMWQGQLDSFKEYVAVRNPREPR